MVSRRIAPSLERGGVVELAAAHEAPEPHRVARALRALGLPAVSVLESALDVDGLGRHSFVLAAPRERAEALPGRPLRIAPRAPSAPGDPLAALRARLDELAPPRARALAREAGIPFVGGALLVLAYDYGRRLERWPERAARIEPPVPDLTAHVHESVLAWDHARGRVLWAGRARDGGLGPDLAREALEAASCLPEDRPPPPPLAAGRLGRARSNLSPDDYRRAVARVRRYVRAGDVFQVNLAQRFEAPLPVPAEQLYARLRAISPSPFMADVDLGGGRRVLSTSPERFLRLEPSGRVETWPIKGTRPRGRTAREDATLLRALLASGKDAAELAMIVDLARNDLGRVARPGSVLVREARRAQSWPAVHHTVSVVEARLDAGLRWDDLVRAAFPPASVTGAPKLRACEIVDELEPVRRGVYTGALGWVGWDGALDLSVLIRTVFVSGERALAHAGGGITLGSRPEAERRETLAKARGILRALS